MKSGWVQHVNAEIWDLDLGYNRTSDFIFLVYIKLETDLV